MADVWEMNGSAGQSALLGQSSIDSVQCMLVNKSRRGRILVDMGGLTVQWPGGKLSSFLTFCFHSKFMLF